MEMLKPIDWIGGNKFDTLAFTAKGFAMKETNESSDGPNPVDRHVGLRIRLRRRELGMTQTDLAEAIGLTFQQVQKYERAANRVSASKLWEMARVLHTGVAY